MTLNIVSWKIQPIKFKLALWDKVWMMMINIKEFLNTFTPIIIKFFAIQAHL